MLCKCSFQTSIWLGLALLALIGSYSSDASACSRDYWVSTTGSDEGTGRVDERKLEKILSDVFPLRPTHIRRTLQLNKPIYKRTAAYGHFGRKPDKDGGFSWERTDLAAELKRAFGAR